MSVTVGTVLKKVAEVLVSSKSGRKFIGYTVGITLFLVLLPMIGIVGLFGDSDMIAIIAVAVLIIGIGVGIGFIVAVQNKYNKGIF